MGMLDGKICIVTGGAGSLGLASARLLLKEGGRVMLVDNNGDELTQGSWQRLRGTPIPS